MWRARILSTLVWLFYRLWTSTWRTSIVESESLKQLKSSGASWVSAMWHGDELALVHFTPNYRIATLTSTSKDGEIMDRVLHRFGVATSRGSSTRGGVSALKGLIRLAREGWSPVVPVDGPKGPRNVVKPGVFELSRLTGLPIIPAGVFSSNSYVFKKSWNLAHLPLPFSKVVLVWGDRFEFAPEKDPRDPALAADLARAIDATGRTALKLFAKKT